MIALGILPAFRNPLLAARLARNLNLSRRQKYFDLLRPAWERHFDIAANRGNVKIQIHSLIIGRKCKLH
jgi:hypothetical protein